MINFETIYNENYNNVLNYINSKIKDRLTAEDLTAEVFEKVYKHLESGISGAFNSEKAKFNTWLMAITNNHLIDHFRKTANDNRVQNVSDFVNEEGDEIFQFVGSKDSETDFDINEIELKNRLDKAFDSLKPKYKRVAELYFRKEMKYIEIAEMCQIPIGTVKATIMRCREMLQAELKSLHNVRKVVMA
jgi:RNA polymerase sigma-70 factor (ECF subfamily)